VVGHVGRDGERLAAGLDHVLRGAVQAGLPAGDEPHARAAGTVQPRGGAGDTGAGTGDDNGLRHGSCVPSGIIRSAAVVNTPGKQGLAAVPRYPAGVVSPLPSGKNDIRSGRLGLDRRSLCL